MWGNLHRRRHVLSSWLFNIRVRGARHLSPLRVLMEGGPVTAPGAPVAQLVRARLISVRVGGSSPPWRTSLRPSATAGEASLHDMGEQHFNQEGRGSVVRALPLQRQGSEVRLPPVLQTSPLGFVGRPEG